MTNRAHAIHDSAEGHADGPAANGRTLAAGTRLREYEVTSVLAEGGFDIVYLAWDTALQRKVALKEYLPMALAARVAGGPAIAPHGEREREAFKAGLKSFVAEAKLLARFDHPSLVKVYRFWEENGTAYRVMPLYDGPTLETALANLDHVPSEAELRAWLKPVLNGLALLHEGGALHQNIGPDSIVLTPVGPVLFGLGAAQQVIAALLHSPASSLKPGFAAIEQYGSAAGATRGPWTDLYALAAVIYAAITGAPPPPAADRLANDTLRPLSLVAAGLYDERFLAAIDATLAVEPDQRPSDHQRFRMLMGDIDAPAPVELAPPRDLMHEPFAGTPGGDREITVPDHPLLSIGDAPDKGAAAKPAGAVAPRAAPLERPARAADGTAAPRTSTRTKAPWMRASTAGGATGKRALYGLVAGTCVLIGVAALALQFQARQAAHATPTAPAAAVPAPVVAAPIVASPIAAPPVAATPVAASRSPSAVATAVTPVPAPAPSRPASATIATPLPPAASATATPTRPAVAGDDPSTLATPAERLARCSDILQKASLERITPAETNYFKTECK